MRKLGLTAGFFSAAVVLSQYLLPASFQFWTGAAFLTFFVALLFIRRCRALRYAALGLAVGLMWNYACAACGLFLSSARELDGGTRTVEAEVLAYPENTDYGKSVLILVDTEDSAFGAKCRLYIYDEDYAPLEPGDKIRVCASFVLTGAKTGDDYYYSIGIPLFAYAVSEPELLGKTPVDMLGSLRFIPVKAGRLLGESIDGVCGPAAPLVKAIITGDRNDLRADTYMYSLMNVTGVIHCVSVSGMHVSFLAGLIYFLLGKRRFASLVCVFSVLFFMAMTGFSAPVVRAGVMQLAICGASLTRREYDPKTALFLSLALLLLLNPYGARNAGLQLSFGATLGILLFNERLCGAINERLGGLYGLKILGGAVKWLASTLSVSLCALIFTVPLTALIFERVSVIAPAANLLTLWAVSLCFAAGLISALIGLIWPPLGSLLALPALLLVRYIYWVLALLGRMPFASVYTGSVYIRFWLLFLYAALVWLIASRRQAHKGPAFALFSAISLTAALFFSLTEANADDMRFAALDVGQGQCLAITAKGYAAVIDCGGSSARNAGDLAAEYLSSLGRTGLDCLILTHCHEDHAGGAAELIRRLRVGKLIVPRVADAEGGLFAEIAARASERGTEIMTIGDQVYSFQESGLSFTLVPPLGGSGENELCLCALVSCGDFDCLVTGDIGSETELRLIERLDLPDVELMMAGHHGSEYSTSRELLEAARPEAVVISVGHNIYGHPSEETLDRLAAWNGEVRVYRTDELGDITVTYDGGQQ